MEFIVKWIIIDEILNYSPCFKIFTDYNDARNFQVEKEEELATQENRLDEIFIGKIISEPILEEIISKNKPDKMPFQVDKILFCEKCNDTVIRIIVRMPIDAVMAWNPLDGKYEVKEDEYANFEEATSVRCANCISEFLKQE